jgi:hypothetical protein
MFYAMHDKDGSLTGGNVGQLVQAVKVFVGDDEQKAFEKQLSNQGQTFVKERAQGVLPPEKWMVSNNGLHKRPRMNPTAQAAVVKAGNAIVVLGIPKGARITVKTGATIIWPEFALDGDELEFPSADYPCTYTVLIRKWPYMDRKLDVRTVASL